jgi:hypothetical protein
MGLIMDNMDEIDEIEFKAHIVVYSDVGHKRVIMTLINFIEKFLRH